MRAIKDIEFEEKLIELDVYGYCRIKNLLDTESVEMLKHKVESLYQGNLHNKVKYRGVPDRDAEDKIVYNIQNKDKIFIDTILNDTTKKFFIEKLNDPYYRVMGQEKLNAILLYYNARSSGQELDLHIDSYIPYLGDKCYIMQYAILLDDQDETNGCTVVVPGSHKSGQFTNRSIKNRKLLTANRGDLIMWDSRLWHGTLANQSQKTRWSLIATVGMWWLKQSMQITKSLPDSIFNNLNDEQKAFLGFCSIPPVDEHERINTKCGHEFLKGLERGQQ